MINALRAHVVVCGAMLLVPAVRPAIASGAILAAGFLFAPGVRVQVSSKPPVRFR